MKKLLSFLLLLVIGIFVVVYDFKKTETLEKSESIKDFRVIAKFDKTIIPGNTLLTNVDSIHSSNIRKLLKKYKINELQAVFKNRYKKVEDSKRTQNNKDNQYFLEGWQELIMKDKTNANKLVNSLMKKKGVIVAYLETPIVVKPYLIPNDTGFGNQWHLRSSAQPLSDIDAEFAWDINRGRNDVIIAVCDGGVDYNHSDLDPGDRSRVIVGYDSGDDDDDPMDDLPDQAEGSFAGHGTNVAGVIGAITNNQNHVAGVMWNCKIMPVKMVGSGRLEITYPFGSYNWDFSTTAFPSDVADGIDYAVNNNANVINLSYGFADMGAPINEVILRVPLLAEAISNAYENNVVVVVAMGNEYEEGNPKNYPAAFAHYVIAVGATDMNSQRADFSSTGQHISVSAPGVGINTTEKGGTSNNPSGTSFSAPIVSGIAGLVISQGLDRNFNLTNEDVRSILEISADDIDPIGFDENTGHGKVNAFRALDLLHEPNMLYHDISISGSSSIVQTIANWIYVGGGRWGLASGMYLNVDQYQITKHIDFSIPFCSIPQVWIRPRESVSMSFGSPNDGFPWTEISNITLTGFDVRYSAYYVRYNLIGQAINKWVPSTPASTMLAYTAVGEPNIAGTAGPISGPSIVCSSGSIYTVNNLPAGCTIEWTTGSFLTRVSPPGSNPCTFSSTGKGSSWIKATINSSCGSATLPQYTVWAGTPILNYVTGPGSGYTYNTYTFYADPRRDPLSQAEYTWILNPLNGNSVRPYYDYTDISFYTSGGYQVVARAENTCGTSDWAVTGISISDNYSYSLSPNPASGNLTIMVTKLASTEAEATNPELTTYTVNIFNFYGILQSSVKKTGTNFTIPVGNLKDGNYFVQISNGKITKSLPLIIKH